MNFNDINIYFEVTFQTCTHAFKSEKIPRCHKFFLGQNSLSMLITQSNNVVALKFKKQFDARRQEVPSYVISKRKSTIKQTYNHQQEDRNFSATSIRVTAVVVKTFQEKWPTTECGLAAFFDAARHSLVVVGIKMVLLVRRKTMAWAP